jgi:hypothetical protein
VVEQNAGGGKQTICLPVVRHRPKGRRLSDRVGTARPELGRLVCRLVLRIAEALARGSVVEPGIECKKAHGLHHVDGPVHYAVDRLDRLVEGKSDRGLCRKIVNVPGLYLLQRRDHAAEVAEHGRMQRDLFEDTEGSQAGEAAGFLVAGGAVHREALAQQEVGQIGAVLARNTQDQSRPLVRLHDRALLRPNLRPAIGRFRNSDRTMTG